MCRLATFDSPLPPPPSSTTCCAPCVLLAGLFFDSYRFAAPHDAARRRWRFILPGSCNSFPKICMRKRGAQAEGRGGGKGMKERRSEAKRHHYIGYALSSLPAYATPPTPCCCCCCLPHSTHLQYVRVMRHKPPTRTHFLLFSQLKTLPSLALCFVHV